MARPSCRLGTWLAAAALSLAAGAAIAQEPDDCGHPIPERSARACSALIAKAPADPRRLAALLIERGKYYIVLGDLAAAIADLNRAIALAPDNAAARTMRGDAFNRRAGVSAFVARRGAAAQRDEKVEPERDRLKRRDYQRAVADYTAAIKLDRFQRPAYYGRAQARYALGDNNKAAERDERDVGMPPPYFHRSQSAFIVHVSAVLVEPANYTKSATERFAPLDADVRDRPNDPKPYVERAWAFVNYGQSARALADYTKAIAVDPNFVEAWQGRGDELLEAGETARALADYEQVVRLTPDHFRGYDARGFAYEKLGERDKAIADYRKALSLEPRAGFASNRLEPLLAKR
jgi:tetratricopeptide (TPR) repeat protein